MPVVNEDIEPLVFFFEDDGIVPNNAMPFLAYRQAVDVANDHPEKTVEGLFGANGWGDMWRNGVYDYLHYPCDGSRSARRGAGACAGQVRRRPRQGNRGRSGGRRILPAGTGHQCLWASQDFSVVGAYPTGAKMQVTLPTPENHQKALKTIPAVRLPDADPVRGADGPLVKLWK